MQGILFVFALRECHFRRRREGEDRGGIKKIGNPIRVSISGWDVLIIYL